MHTIAPNIQRAIDEFLHNVPSITPGLETVVLCGSQANGMATEHSDIDLCYIGKFSEFKREYKIFHGYEFQIMIAPWEWYNDVLSSYERKGNVGTITTMLATGICLWTSEANKWSDLQQIAMKYFRLGPTPASEEERSRIKRKITELWQNYIDSDRELTSIWLQNQILIQCIEAQFILNNWWAVKPKYQMAELQKRDPKLLSYIQMCMVSPNDDSAVLKRVYDYVLNGLNTGG